VNPTMARTLRIATELLIIAVAVAVLVTGVMLALEAPSFDHPYRGENAQRNFITGSVVLSGLGTLAAWVLWLTWRHRAALDAQPDGPARLLAAAVATLPEARLDWGAAMMAELSSITGSSARWGFATSSARAAIFAPIGGRRRPAGGRLGGAVAVLGVISCAAAVGYLSLAYPGTFEVRSALFTAVLMVFLAVCLWLSLLAPPILTSSGLATRVGLFFGIGSGLGLLLFSHSSAVEPGAMGFILPAQFVLFVLVPMAVAGITGSLRAAVQAIVAGFVFSGVTMFPVYIFESIRRYNSGGGLYLDGDALSGTNIGTNLGDAVSWLLLVVPCLMIPLGIVSAALVTVVVRAIRRAARSGTAV
jgi:hypothetical protein